MGTISNPRAIYGLIATGTPTKTQVANDAEIGIGATTLALTGATKAYCINATLAGILNEVVIDLTTGIATFSPNPVSQVETATVVAGAGATSSGNLAVTVTAAGVTGSPLAFSVALVSGVDTTATLIAAKIRTAFNASAALVALYTVGGSGADVTLTRTVAANNDSTLNIAITAGLGVSAIASSTNTVTGVGGVVLKNNGGDGKDFEGITLGTGLDTKAILVRVISGEVDLTINGNSTGTLVTGEFLMMSKPDSGVVGGVNIVSSSEDCEFEATILA